MIKKKNIDIIVPVYNQSNFILSFLESAECLSKEKFNVILVNDGSTDNSAEIIAKFINDRSLTNFFILNKENHGVSSARNSGLELTCSDYIWFCDPDDKITVNEDSLFYHLNDTIIDVFICSYEIYKVDSSSSRKIIRPLYTGDGVDFLIKNNSLSHTYDHPASDGTLWDKIYRRELIKDLRFNPTLTCSEDFDFNLNCFKVAKKVSCLDSVIYRYNVYSKGTLSSMFNKKILEDRIYAERETIKFLMKYKKNVRSEIKKHILKNTNLLSVNSLSGVFGFYLSEHALFNQRIYPFTSYKEMTFAILSFIKLYDPFIGFYRKMKRRL